MTDDDAQLEEATVAEEVDGDVDAAVALPSSPPLIERRFTRPEMHPYDDIEWAYRSANITSDTGDTIFEQNDVEVPAFWSQNATNIVVSKYFHGAVDSPQRENSIKGLIDRVVNTITAWGRDGGYFRGAGEADAFEQELRFLLVNQYAAFNSPVWFNVGVEAKPQCSACFINSVEDTMEDRLQSLHAALQQGTAQRGRHPLRSGLLHARLRRLRQRDQVRR